MGSPTSTENLAGMSVTVEIPANLFVSAEMTPSITFYFL